MLSFFLKLQFCRFFLHLLELMMIWCIFSHEMPINLFVYKLSFTLDHHLRLVLLYYCYVVFSQYMKKYFSEILISFTNVHVYMVTCRRYKICRSHTNMCDFRASNKVFLCLQSLSDLARLNDGRVVCPRTKEIFHLDEAEKVFVMWILCFKKTCIAYM